MHALSDAVEKSAGLDPAELRLRIRQLESCETRTLLIVRALTCFYTAVAGFVASTLVSLIGAVVVAGGIERGVLFTFALAFLAGSVAVCAMIAGAAMLARETTFSYRMLREEKDFVTARVREQASTVMQSAPAKSI
jgi:membrane glycosyltransferase